MKRRIAAIVLGLAVAGTVSTAAIAAAGDDPRPAPHSKAPHAQKKAPHPEKADRSDPGWKDAWRALTPAQREATMRGLARQHADGMRAWAACAGKAGADRSARAACERPLPPGLAKKQLGR